MADKPNRTAAAPHWSPESWQKKAAVQLPVYPDDKALHDALSQLAKLPPLVTSWEIENLKQQLADVTRGERFLLQGGDCAESFEDCESTAIAGKLKILLQMSLVLVQGARKKVIRIGRIAGQYAKPRSADFETRAGIALPSHRGDMINRAGFTATERTPDPALLLRAYERSALTINFIRALIEGGFADCIIRNIGSWVLLLIRRARRTTRGWWNRSGKRCGSWRLAGAVMADINRVDFFTSHEGLQLHYEQAQTRQVPRRTGWYNLSTHFPWIGERTRAWMVRTWNTFAASPIRSRSDRAIA